MPCTVASRGANAEEKCPALLAVLEPAFLSEASYYSLNRVTGDGPLPAEGLPDFADGHFAAVPNDAHDFQLGVGERGKSIYSGHVRAFNGYNRHL